MDTNAYYAVLGPAFIAFALLEHLALRRRGARGHRLPDTLSSFACGLGQVLVGLLTVAGILAAYRFGEGFAIVRWGEGSWVPWVLAFVGVDLCYYAFHRASHAVPVFWALHEVHHQSNEMNLSVAVRQTWLSDLPAFLFFWPLPVLGVPEEVFFVAVAVLSLYEALMHTRLLDGARSRWGRVFNTPSFHRLHHARESAYRDHNFGSTLIVWDRLFGTFAAPTVPATYGLPRPFESADPVWAQLSPWRRLWRYARAAPTPGAALRRLVRWEPAAPREAATPDAQAPPRNGPPAPWRSAYALTHFVLIAGASAALLFAAPLFAAPTEPSLARTALAVAALIASTSTVAGVLAGRPRAAAAELARLAGAPVVLAALGAPALAVIGAGLVALVSGAAIGAAARRDARRRRGVVRRTSTKGAPSLHERARRV